MTTWMKGKDMVLSEVSQSQKDNPAVIPLTGGFLLNSQKQKIEPWS